MGYKGYKTANENVFTENYSTIIVIDPGHGGEDPGATDNELVEKQLNLQVSLKLNDFLKINGYATVLTRSDDRLLYNVGEENKKKYFDLRNRASIANEYNDCLFVSIHMNKFPLESCRGLQVFYSSNNENGIVLAESVQSNISNLQTDNERTVKCGNESIYLLETLKMPAILVECGFISNPEEAKLLSNDLYQNALALCLYCGIMEFMEN
jgi:N-acetylmuramoyl-L-alanine amidase